jgi:hypothetical protein
VSGTGVNAGSPVRWSELTEQAPTIATAGRELLYQYGPGLAYLATLRPDGAPRLHPVCPVLAHGGLYVFVGNHSPKLADLRRDGRFALHTFPRQDVDDEFMVSGVAVDAEDTGAREPVYAAYTATGSTTSDDTLFELLVDRALHAQYEGRPSWPPTYSRWRA